MKLSYDVLVLSILMLNINLITTMAWSQELTQSESEVSTTSTFDSSQINTPKKTKKSKTLAPSTPPQETLAPSTPPQETLAPSTPPQEAPVDESLPIYMSTRFTMVIPEEASTDAFTMGLGVGLADQSGNFFGLRLVWIPEVPQNMLSQNSSEPKSAWGPVLEWQNLFSYQGRLSFFSNVAGGFVYGVPNDSEGNEAAQSIKSSSKNEILPILELGFGLKVVSKQLGSYRFFIAPEFGYVFTGRSPYACISVGIY